MYTPFDVEILPMESLLLRSTAIILQLGDYMRCTFSGTKIGVVTDSVNSPSPVAVKELKAEQLPVNVKNV